MNFKFSSFGGFLSGMFSYLTNLASRLIGPSSESVLHHLVRAQGTNRVPLWKTIRNCRRNIEGCIILYIWNNTNPWCVMPKRQITNLMLGFPMKHPNIVLSTMTSKGIIAGFTFPSLSKTSICNSNLQLNSSSIRVLKLFQNIG